MFATAGTLIGFVKKTWLSLTNTVIPPPHPLGASFSDYSDINGISDIRIILNVGSSQLSQHSQKTDNIRCVLAAAMDWQTRVPFPSLS